MRINGIMQELSLPFLTLRNNLFARLYYAQAISLLGDAFTWIGLALLSYQFGKERSAIILATALTLRITAFILFSPFAGVLADRFSRKAILCITHFVRMGIIACFPLVNAEWQVYVLVFFLNIFNAFFTPVYRSVIPQVVDPAYYRQAIGLSNATFQILGILGPGLAGIFAVWFGLNEIFFIDAISFVVAALLILTLPSDQLQPEREPEERTFAAWEEALKGIHLLFSNPLVRFALFIELVSSIAGAQILVNTVGLIKTSLLLEDQQYGWVMAVFGIGAGIAAFVAGSADKTKTRQVSLISGATILALGIGTANFVSYPVLLIMWAIAGLGNTLAEMPAETLIGETVPGREQGKVYGAHFSFSHLWWAIAYPLAGYIGTNYPDKNFLYGSLISLALLLLVSIFLRPKDNN